MAKAFYRARQFWSAMLPASFDSEFARRHLTTAEFALFDAMQRRDQRHALEVAGRLLQQGVVDPDLLTAALLHDCAKLDAPIWLRVARVLAPGLVRAAGRPGATGWRAAAHRLADDSALSADLAEKAGSTATAVALIRGQVADGQREQLRLLRAADDAS